MNVGQLSFKKAVPRFDQSWLLGAGRFIVLIIVAILMTFLTRSPEQGFVFLR